MMSPEDGSLELGPGGGAGVLRVCVCVCEGSAVSFLLMLCANSSWMLRVGAVLSTSYSNISKNVHGLESKVKMKIKGVILQ